LSWLQLDDRILEHPKFIRAAKRGGSEAIHLWLGIRAYCGQLLTDGFVPEDMLDEVRGPKDPEKRALALRVLIEEKLLHRVEGGVEMHDYLDWSESKRDILKRRKNWKEKKNRQRGGKPSNTETSVGVPELSPGDTTETLASVPDPRARAHGEGRGSDQDQDLSEGEDGEAPSVAIAPVAPDQRRWPAEEWFEAFRIQRLTYYQGSYAGRPNDFGAISDLRTILSRLPLDESLAAQKRAPKMFAEYFSDRGEDVAAARHPWSWFVQRFDGLRFPKKAAPADDRCAYHRAAGTRGKLPRGGGYDSCPECRHAKAASGTRQSEPAPLTDALAAATERKVAELRAAGEKAWTPEQLAEMRETLQRDRQPPKAAVG